MNHEFKRMMELAGLTEIKINKPKVFTRFNLPFDPADRIKIPIDDIDHEYSNLVDNIVDANPQIDPKFLRIDGGIYDDTMDTIDSDYNGEVTVPEFYKIYFEWLWANLVADYSKFDDHEISDRDFKYGHMRSEFADNVMGGKWLVVPDVTA